VTVVLAIRYHQVKNMALLKSQNPVEQLKSQDKDAAFKRLQLSMIAALLLEVTSIFFSALSVIDSSNLLYRIGMFFYSVEINCELYYMLNVKILMVGREHKQITPDSSALSQTSETQSNGN